MSRAWARSFYGATIDKIEVVKTGIDGKRDYRVWFHDADGSGNAPMRPSANPTAIRVGETADVIRNGNGRIVMLRRPEAGAAAGAGQLDEIAPNVSDVSAETQLEEAIRDIGILPTMTATLQIDLTKTEAIERIGEFLEDMNVVAITVASGGKSVQCTGLVVSLVPVDR